MESKTHLHIQMPNVLIHGSYRDPITGNKTRAGEALEIRWDFLMDDLAECLPEGSIYCRKWTNGSAFVLTESADFTVVAEYENNLVLHIEAAQIEQVETYLKQISTRLEINLSGANHVCH